VGDEAMHLRSLNTLGWLYTELGDLDRAIAPNQQSAEGGRQRNDVETAANAELNLGDLFLAKGDLALAREFFDGVYRLAKDPTTTEWLKWRYSMHLFASFGEWWLAYGDPSTAQEFMEQGLELATRTNSRKYLVQCRRLQGNIALARGLHHEAEYQFQQALTLAQTLANPTQLWKTHLSWGQLHDAAHRREMAQQSYQTARAVIDQIKATVQTPDLRANMGHSPMMQHVYDLAVS
jgi:tetratricopeptide (TPR) repeat protein